MARSLLKGIKRPDSEEISGPSHGGATTSSSPINSNRSLREVKDGQVPEHDQSEREHISPNLHQSIRQFRLVEALRNEDLSAIEGLLHQAASADAATNPLDLGRNTTLLHLAVQCANLPIIERILKNKNRSSGEANEEVNIRDRDGNTPLHLASTLGRTLVVQLLLNQPGIDDLVVNLAGKTALDLSRTPEIAQVLQLHRSLDIDTKTRKIKDCISMQDYHRLEELLERPNFDQGIDINSFELVTDPVVSIAGGNLLHQAALKRDVRLIELLLTHGADPFMRDRRGKLPQDIAKDDKVKAMLKKSPAVTTAQRNIQEQSVLGTGQERKSQQGTGTKSSREMKGYLKKWTNYSSGYKLRWFVLEDGVMSYYKNQDDAGSACRGAINMKIAKLYMDSQDKTRFEVQGKSSVKYHLKANHIVEAKRWFWTLNNAVQYSKDMVKKEDASHGPPTIPTGGADTSPSKSILGTAKTTRGVSANRSLDLQHSDLRQLRQAQQDPNLTSKLENESIDDSASDQIVESMPRVSRKTHDQDPRRTAVNRITADEDNNSLDASDTGAQMNARDAFDLIAHSAEMQLDVLARVSSALTQESKEAEAKSLSDVSVVEALLAYDSAVANIRGLIGNLQKLSIDRDARWQTRLDDEINMRHVWEDSMARIVVEQDELQGRIEHSESRRRKTKKALREVLEEHQSSRPTSPQATTSVAPFSPPTEQLDQPSGTSMNTNKTPPELSAAAELSDNEAEDEFFDAVDAGEIQIIDVAEPKTTPETIPSLAELNLTPDKSVNVQDHQAMDIQASFRGYEDPVRTKLAMTVDDRPKISLWGILKSMIGKDMTKMTLPVSFNEPTSLLQRVAEDMEYADLLDTAVDQTDSLQRMVYVAAFAASEYASTIGRVAKPFNPLLGETYEYVRPDKGYRFLIEQVSHHPPIGAAWAEARRWEYFGESAVKSKFYGKSFDINPLGTWFLRIRPKDGAAEELYTWKKVTSSVIGIITGNPTVDNYGCMEIKNHKTGDLCTLDFKPRGWKASSAYQMIGRISGPDGRTKWSIGGRWNDKIYARLTPGFEDAAIDSPPTIAGRRAGDANQAFLVWKANPRLADIPFNLTTFAVSFQALPDRLRPYLPPTDTRLRPDQVAMELGQYDKAAIEKDRVEQQQRARRRAREERGEEFTPLWFNKTRCNISGEEYWQSTGQYWRTREEVCAGKARWTGMDDIFGNDDSSTIA